jgi:GNAT superfamily N-acetyltransferase
VKLDYLLGHVGTIPAIGEEQDIWQRGQIACYKSPHGSYRFVRYHDHLIVSALQLVSDDDGKTAMLANVFTRPVFRRQRLAASLFDAAREFFREIFPAQHLSQEGRAWQEFVLTHSDT